MTSRDLAAKADISPGFLSQIENGARDDSFETIRRLPLP
ncbi:helix-turn-helix transcriptional regulator [Rhizobium sp. R635]|nr:helix-turn-helix transcriptional regulator [Rhizobium sp. R635]